jgi:hypothetical protein
MIMGKIYIKTISGRQYKYERISSKRVDGKVRTVDKYLGAVKPVQGAIDNMGKDKTDKIKSLWLTGGGDDALVARVSTYTMRKYAKNTVVKWCREKFGKRPRTRKF